MKKINQLNKEFEANAKAWRDTNSTDRQKDYFKYENKRIENELSMWEERTIPLQERMNQLTQNEDQLFGDRKKLLKELPQLEHREKGEAFEQLFKKVSLFWDRKFHPNQKNPSRPRRTDRKEKYSYTLRVDKIQWEIDDLIMNGSA